MQTSQSSLYPEDPAKGVTGTAKDYIKSDTRLNETDRLLQYTFDGIHLGVIELR
jgi:hypothetical protein